MQKTHFIVSIAMSGIALPQSAYADCVDCSGDVAIIKNETDFFDGAMHSHEFGELCEATDLAGYTQEVTITIRAVGDFAGADNYVTANFVSGQNSTPITSGNGFIGAPSDGKFFKDDGQSDCPGVKHQATVYLDYDDFNALINAGDGTVTIEVTASAAVEDLCELCCEGGHSWTPDTCCGEINPCACPPAVETYSEVILIYLDCEVVGPTATCSQQNPCQDDGFECNGDEFCNAQGQCEHTGNPCLAENLLCYENHENDEYLPDLCVSCIWDAYIGSTCEEQAGDIFCDGASVCCYDGVGCTIDECYVTDSCEEGELCVESVDACFECE